MNLNFVSFVFVTLSLFCHAAPTFANSMAQLQRVPLEDLEPATSLTCANSNEQWLMICTKLTQTTCSHPETILFCREPSKMPYALFEFQGGEVLRLNNLQGIPSKLSTARPHSILMPLRGQSYFLRQTEGRQFRLASWRSSQPSFMYPTQEAPNRS